MDRFIGILPAAGASSRLQPFRYPKELLPVRFRRLDDGSIIPSLVIEHSLAALELAAVDMCVVVVSETKPELLKYLGDGEQVGVPIAYVVQTHRLGLAHAVDLASRWSSSLACNYCLALPDTIFEPVEALRVVREELLAKKADLVLGVFPTSSPEQLGPVRIGRDGRILEVLDKPEKTTLKNTWAVAAWTPRFAQLLHEQVAHSAGGVVLGEIFDRASRIQMHARAVYFPDGAFHDLGTRSGLAEMAGNH